MDKTAYEAIYIVESTLADEAVRAITDKYKGIIEAGGGIVDDTDVWEPRRLAYPIKNRREGIYVVVNFLADTATKNELDRIFRISDDTLRTMIVKQSEKADRYPSKARAAEQERREREAAARAAAQASNAANAEAAQPTVTDLPESTSASTDDESASEE